MNKIHYVTTGEWSAGVHLFKIQGVTCEYIGTYFLHKHLTEALFEENSDGDFTYATHLGANYVSMGRGDGGF